MQKKYSQVNSSNRITVYPEPSKILVMLSMPKLWEWEKMSVEIKSLWKETHLQRWIRQAEDTWIELVRVMDFFGVDC